MHKPFLAAFGAVSLLAGGGAVASPAPGTRSPSAQAAAKTINPRSCALRRRGSCTRRLRRRGTYRFLCSVHAGMTGKIRRR
ncbi:MAG: hypothetical protein WKF32_01885 [Thermoleophilaceae bacterium]